LIFAAWAHALARRIYGDELGDAVGGRGYRAEFTLRVLDDVDGASRWCDDRGTPPQEDCASRIRAALADAIAELSAAYGGDPASWRWGEAHPAIHAARPLSDMPLIGGYFRREVTMDGGPFTVKRADNAMSGPRPYAAIHGSGYRAIYDLGHADNSRYIISTGQSGNSYSPHYDDLLPLWADGAYVAIPFSPEAIEKSAAHHLTFQPVKPVQVP
jgi:penicillin amidase